MRLNLLAKPRADEQDFTIGTESQQLIIPNSGNIGSGCCHKKSNKQHNYIT